MGRIIYLDPTMVGTLTAPMLTHWTPQEHTMVHQVRAARMNAAGTIPATMAMTRMYASARRFADIVV